MTGTTTRADKGEAINPRAVLQCVVCGARLGALALHSMPGDTSDVLCGRCVTKRSLHSRYWPKCDNHTHDLFSHPLHHRRRATALATIKERSTR